VGLFQVDYTVGVRLRRSHCLEYASCVFGSEAYLPCFLISRRPFKKACSVHCPFIVYFFYGVDDKLLTKFPSNDALNSPVHCQSLQRGFDTECRGARLNEYEKSWLLDTVTAVHVHVKLCSVILYLFFTLPHRTFGDYESLIVPSLDLAYNSNPAFNAHIHFISETPKSS